MRLTFAPEPPNVYPKWEKMFTAAYQNVGSSAAAASKSNVVEATFAAGIQESQRLWAAGSPPAGMIGSTVTYLEDPTSNRR